MISSIYTKMLDKLFMFRLVTDCEGKQNGMGYIEFASAKEAEKVNRSDLNYYYFFKV